MELHKSNYGAPIPNTIHKYNCGSMKICSGKWGDTVSKLFLKITHLYVAVLCPLHWLSTSNPSDWLDGPSIIIVTSSNGNIFRVILAICVGNSPVTGEFPAQRPVTRGFGVSLICAWINGWVNNRGASDFRRHRAHYDVTLMWRPTVGLPARMREQLTGPVFSSPRLCTTRATLNAEIPSVAWTHIRTEG